MERTVLAKSMEQHRDRGLRPPEGSSFGSCDGGGVFVQVKMTDMQVRGTPRDMLPGDPQCAPLPAVLAESYVTLLRKLVNHSGWNKQVCDPLGSSARFSELSLPRRSLEIQAVVLVHNHTVMYRNANYRSTLLWWSLNRLNFFKIQCSDHNS
ncbi:hypothetical protein PR048_004019 [Dryococelus australis]|uniref:Uncharacterized protein n=1 Tax=Dryococelus australis TaxID=614101 RepID=A0ABQ9I4A3_9NEOP|nr:hypothetical protein PR048_004019 [Dryococelus australis]